MEKNKIIFNMSGGGTSIGSLAAHAYNVINKEKISPNIITGVSSGAILSLPVFLRKWKTIEKMVTEFKSSDIFDLKPKIAIRGISRIIIGKPSLGLQNNLEKTIRNIITIKDFNKFKFLYHKKLITIYVGKTDMNSKKFILVDIGLLSYEEYIKEVMASATIPVAVPPVVDNGRYYYDGGIINHICSYPVRKKYHGRIKSIITAFSRPEELPFDANHKAVDILQVGEDSFELLLFSNSQKDGYLEEEYCQGNNVPLVQLFTPKIMKGTYDTDPLRLKQLYYSVLDSHEYQNQLINLKKII